MTLKRAYSPYTILGLQDTVYGPNAMVPSESPQLPFQVTIPSSGDHPGVSGERQPQKYTPILRRPHIHMALKRGTLGGVLVKAAVFFFLVPVLGIVLMSLLLLPLSI